MYGASEHLTSPMDIERYKSRRKASNSARREEQRPEGGGERLEPEPYGSGSKSGGIDGTRTRGLRRDRPAL